MRVAWAVRSVWVAVVLAWFMAFQFGMGWRGELRSVRRYTWSEIGAIRTWLQANGIASVQDAARCVSGPNMHNLLAGLRVDLPFEAIPTMCPATYLAWANTPDLPKGVAALAHRGGLTLAAWTSPHQPPAGCWTRTPTTTNERPVTWCGPNTLADTPDSKAAFPTFAALPQSPWGGCISFSASVGSRSPTTLVALPRCPGSGSEGPDVNDLAETRVAHVWAGLAQEATWCRQRWDPGADGLPPLVEWPGDLGTTRLCE